MTDRSFQLANDASRDRLARLVAALTPAQLAVDLGGGWTVASALGHMGFWDRWQAERWDRMLDGEWSADDASVIAAEAIANLALDPYWAGISAADLPALALAAATRLDALVAAAPDALVDELEGGLTGYLLHRHRHRGEHLDHIERGLAAAAAAGTAVPASVDSSYLERNESSLVRLREVAGRLTPADLARTTAPSDEGSWTVGQTLGHLAFWERFLHSRWQAALAAGPGRQPSWLADEVAPLLNGGLPPTWGAFATAAGDAAIADAIDAAEQTNRLIASLPAETPVAAIMADRPALLDRAIHRHQHLDQIERALRG